MFSKNIVLENPHVCAAGANKKIAVHLDRFSIYFSYFCCLGQLAKLRLIYVVRTNRGHQQAPQIWGDTLPTFCPGGGAFASFWLKLTQKLANVTVVLEIQKNIS